MCAAAYAFDPFRFAPIRAVASEPGQLQGVVNQKHTHMHELIPLALQQVLPVYGLEVSTSQSSRAASGGAQRNKIQNGGPTGTFPTRAGSHRLSFALPHLPACGSVPIRSLVCGL